MTHLICANHLAPPLPTSGTHLLTTTLSRRLSTQGINRRSPIARSHHLICQIILHSHYHITGHAAWTTTLPGRLSTQGTPADLWSCCDIGNFSQNAVHYSDTP
ncbi:hypothetical protein KY284_019323 [Solanum tuberosum]|nr:hypothetical protein KY284_019323 [Solanum tuberosum]